MRSWRLLLSGITVDEVSLDVSYADLFVVLREGDARPGPNDWEATVRTEGRHHLVPGTHELLASTPDDLTLSGQAVLRFSDGHQHLFRGDGDLAGVDAAIA